MCGYSIVGVSVCDVLVCKYAWFCTVWVSVCVGFATCGCVCM